MAPLLIFGTGSLARLAHHYAVHELGRQVAAFAVDACYLEQSRGLGMHVVDAQSLASAYPPGEFELFAAVGYRSMVERANIWRRFREAGYRMPTLVSRHAYVAPDATLGPNTIVMPGAVIEPGVVMGENNVVWSNATVCHDTVVGNHNFIASNATLGGEVRVGSRCFIGFSAVVLQHRVVGDDVLLAAQSLLLTDAADLTHYQGSPARAVKAIAAADGVRVQ